MFAKIAISGLDSAEKNAREILEHVEAIKALQRGSAWSAVDVTVELKEKVDLEVLE